MNKYPSTLQTTSYNFSETNTTPELCAGVVKASKIYPKNPSQHIADLCMLNSAPELRAAFFNPTTGEAKPIECIRVDGAGDEGPSHVEVQYLWTARHLERGSVATLVSTRCSGCSYLNRVELQNGCLALAHANLFIPSTLNGSCLNSDTGEIDQDKLRSNLEAAMNVYIERCNKAPCGNAEILLFKGADSTRLQVKRMDLIIFLKGSNKKKTELKTQKPDLYAEFDKVWSLRNRHMVKNLPSQYVFYLLPCYESTCPHPVCQRGKPTTQITWFDGGPPLTYLPLPVPDKDRSWGMDCESCTSLICCGHYMDPQKAVNVSNSLSTPPPSVVLQNLFSDQKGLFSEDEIETLSRKVLLSTSEVKLWFDHLSTIQKNRKRGATKAAQTRRRKAELLEREVPLVCENTDKEESKRQAEQPMEPSSEKDDTSCEEVKCGVCERIYEDETLEEELWIE